MSKRTVLISCLLAAMTASAAPAQVGEMVGGLTGPAAGPVGQIGGPIGQIGGAGPGMGGIGDPGGLGGLPGIGEVPGVSDLPGATLAGGPGSSNSPAMRFLRGALTPSLDRVVAPMGAVRATPRQMAQMRKARLEVLIRSNQDTLEHGLDGQPVRKAELVVINPDQASLNMATRAGFRVKSDERAGELGLRMVTLALPKGMNVQDGVTALRRAAPRLDVDYNPIFEPAGGALLPAISATLAAAAAARPGTRIAMIDGGVAAHPALGSAAIEQRGFAGPAQPTGHGTAVSSLMVGEQGSFRGAARGAQLFVGDIYGGNPAAGSATAIVNALSWAASKRPAVINISLVGPDNRLLARAIAALQTRGIAVVAAIGNDGPAAPPAYPASYPGVLAVTGVDGGDRALREAGQATHLDFAAPGADLVAAIPGKGFAPVRGTSFAAPFVAARLAATGSTAALAAEAAPGKGKVGRGIVCRACRVPPKAGWPPLIFSLPGMK